jgi:hypothetical protein
LTKRTYFAISAVSVPGVQRRVSPSAATDEAEQRQVVREDVDAVRVAVEAVGLARRERGAGEEGDQVP